MTTLRIVTAVAIATLVIALPVLGMVYVPAYTHALVPAVGGPELSGLPTPTARAAAEDVRRVVAGAPESALPARVDGRAGFGESERAHLADVRSVVAFARWAALVAIGLLAAALALVPGASRRKVAWSSATAAGWVVAGAFVLAGVAGLLDFGALFEQFHGLFFAEGTWTFPYSSLLIQLFPVPFWAISAGVWAGSCLAVAATLVLLGRRQRSEEV